MKMDTIEPARFGRDHLSTLLYLETVIVDNRGRPDVRKLKCNSSRHPYPSCGPWDTKYGTRLADGSTLPQHDDWDCIEDMVAAGWLEWKGTGAAPIFVLTDEGWTQAHRLRRARAEREK